MPIRIKCAICDAYSPRYGFRKRMAWLRRHRRNQHPKLFWKSMRKSIRTRRGY